MAWVSPTGFSDPGSDWGFEERAYDDVIGGSSFAIGNRAGDALELILGAAINCDKVRVYASNYKSGETDPAVEIDVYYGGVWHNIYSGTITKITWVEKNIGSEQSVDKLRVKMTDIPGGGTGRLYEADFWEVEAVLGWTKILYTSEPPTPNAWNQVKQEAGTGWKKLLYV